MMEGIRPYKNYKDTALSWLKDVPAHWRVCRIKTLLQESNLRTLDGDGVLLSLTRTKGLIPYSDRTSKAHSARTLVGYKLFKPSQIVMNRMQAWSGMFGTAKLSGLVSPDYAVYQCLDDVNPDYLTIRLKAPDLVEQFRLSSKGIGSGFNRLYNDKFGAIYTSVPPREEQDSIIKFISYTNGKLDRAIKAKRKSIALLNEQKQVVIHRAVTRGVDSSVSLKNSGIQWIGEVSKHWEVLPLGRILKERIEKNAPVKTDNILSLSLHDGVVPYAEKRSGGNKAKNDLTAYKLAYPGDIVVNSMNVVVGSVGLSRYFGAVSPVYYMLRPRQESDSVDFFAALFHDAVFQRSLFGLGNGIMYIQSRATGKLNTIRMRIPMNKLNRVSIPYPPSEEQSIIAKEIAKETERFTVAISHFENEISLLQEYRARLISDVVTGKLDVQEAAKNLPEEIITELNDDTGDVEDEEEIEEAA